MLLLRQLTTGFLLQWNHSSQLGRFRTYPISNLVCIMDVAIRATCHHMINIAGMIQTLAAKLLTFNVPVIKMPSTNVFIELCVKTTFQRSFPNKF